MMLFLGLTALFASIIQFDSSISHLTHLSGMLIGLLYLKWYKIKKLFPKIIIHDNNSQFSKNKNLKDEIDIILEKLKLDGWEGLSDLEKKQLYSASQYFSKDQSPN